MVDIQLLNVLLILLLTAQTTKHRKDSTGLPLTTSTVKFTFLYVLRLITKASLSPAANNNTTSSKNQTIEMAFDLNAFQRSCHVLSKTSDTSYIGLTAWWALIVDAQKVKVAVRSNNVLPAVFNVKTRQQNKESLLC
ncbi:unnamed protein product [Rotaria magnacalcarata]|uniref:Uncharacterized protein n=1 Tax=Rotaria magnacalcarata TaxID=392030 RepID=A0A819BC56_9BILA|nr:unnamed protein product [Rotaria magnacalcarata]